MKRLSTRQIQNAYAQALGEGRAPVRKQDKNRKKTAPVVARDDIEPVIGLPQVLQDAPAPIRAWTRYLEPSALKQLRGMAALPIIHPHGVAAMPDVHAGSGACVGTVLPLRGALVPSAVGLDAGCGMIAVRLGLRAENLPDNLKEMRLAIEAAIPLGAGGAHDEPVDPGAWEAMRGDYEALCQRHRPIYKRTAALQLGTLGAGNHFIELCLDEAGQAWLMLHSGSRGVGAMIGQHFILRAQRQAREHGQYLPDLSLAWLPQGTEDFEDYRRALLWAQDYARENRRILLGLAMSGIETCLGRRVAIMDKAISCHHNYAVMERHFGEDLWITRKGAIRAGYGELGIIPGSMGSESFIVSGRGVAEALCSCSHGAGRRMTRKDARENYTTQDLRRQTHGIECRKDRAIVDEIPSAYKDIRQVMAEQTDLVEVRHILRQILCVKGS